MSAILSADDLNDFISPGVACIKPIETLPSSPPPSSLEHEVILDGTPAAIAASSSIKQGAPAQISLTDCLACSGCVTSAEAVLVSLQSHTEMLSTLDAAPGIQLQTDGSGNTVITTARTPAEEEDSKLFIATIAPQVSASIAAVAGCSAQQAENMVVNLLTNELGRGGKHGNSFTWVVSTETLNQAVLVLGAEEVTNPQSTQETAIVPSSSSSAAKSVGNVVIVEGAQKKPLLASSCPGWVCYAEKTHPYVLPHLSRVKSAQALAGTMLKSVLSKRLGIGADRIWHLAVMPCFDKKLEASREELTDTTWGDNAGTHHHKGVRDVDCVITTKEILLLAEERGIDFLSLSKESPSSTRTTGIPFPDPKIARFLFPSQTKKPASEAGTSGGQLHFLLHSIAAQNPGSSIHTMRGRNADVIEYVVIDGISGAVLFKAARYYGFRNIQNLVRRLKPARPSRMPGGRPVGGARRPSGKTGGNGTGGTLEYGYVEVMACPGGCTNGGGQVKVDDAVVMAKKGWHAIEGFKPGPQEQKMWLSEVDEAYFSDSSESLAAQHMGDEPDALLVDGISPGYVKSVLEYWAQTVEVDLDRLVHTSFREVVSDVGRDRNKVSETERVIQLAGKIGGGW